MSGLLFRSWREGTPAPDYLPAWSVLAKGTEGGWSFFLVELSSPDGGAGPSQGLEVSVEVDQAAGRVVLARPFSAIRSLFFCKNASGLAVSDDPRLIRPPDAEPDPKALAGLLVLGTLVAPASPWTGVTQILPGTQMVLDFAGMRVQESVIPPWVGETAPAKDLTAHDRRKKTRDVLVAAIREQAQGIEPLTLFSGGVDSSLIALAARDLGFSSTPLLHCSMGDADPETEQARRVAVALKLPFEVVTFRPAEILPNFPSLLRDYPVPFSDYSILPTWYLSREAVKRLKPGAIALDGTAADAAFGQFGGFRKWSNFYRLPLFLREAGAWLYGALKCYRNEGKLDRWLRKPQRTRWFRPEFGNLVVHPMAGIGVNVPRPLLDDLERDMVSWAAQVLPFDDEVKFCMIDIVHQCRGVLAQKDAPAFSAAGRTVGYPYLHPATLRLAMEEVRYWPGQLEPKAILKEVLAAEIGRELVYRPKSGFVLPQVEAFGHPIVLGLVEEILQDRSGLLAAWIDRSVLSSLLEVLRAKKRLALYSYSYIWAIIIAHSWYKICDQSQRPAA